MRVIEKDTVHQLVVNTHIKWYGAIQRILSCSERKRVCIPVRVARTPTIKRSRLFSEANETLTLLDLLIGCYLLAIPTSTKCRIIFIDHAAIGADEYKTNGIFANNDRNGR